VHDRANTLPVIYITRELADETARLLNSFAESSPSEGVVYWFGFQASDGAVVTTLLVPNADTSDGSVRTSVEANAEAIGVIVGTPLVYLGQAHSHPGSRVTHSPTDDHETFARFDGAISVVVPWFGRYGFQLDKCGVHRHVDGNFHQVRDVRSHVRIIPGLADLRPRGDA